MFIIIKRETADHVYKKKIMIEDELNTICT